MNDRESAHLRATLEKSEARYRFLAETIPVQVWTALPDGNLDYVTEQTARSFGLRSADILRDGWLNVLHPDDVAKTVERWTASLTSGDVYEVEFRLRLASGVYAWHLARAVPQRDHDGAIVSWVGTNTNIEEQREERRRMEALLHEVRVQAAESEATFVRLRAENAQQAERIADLERRLAKG